MRRTALFLWMIALLGAASTVQSAPPGATTSKRALSAHQGSHNYAMLTPRFRADRIVVHKSARKLLLMHGDQVIRVYHIALGRYPTGHKIREGDARTPEGRYTVDYRLDSGESKFYRALHISYPNANDRARARWLGVDPGGEIMIHGLPEHWSARQLGHPWLDWTQGCIAVTNREIDEIWRLVSDGTEIDIEP